jgi:predicted Fe-Mo cluster-binding NifX family protein
MKVRVPVTADGQLDPRWGRADRVAVAEVADDEVRDWQEFTVSWGTLHEGTRGRSSCPGGPVPAG